MEYRTITIDGVTVTVSNSIETISLSDCEYDDDNNTDTPTLSGQPIYGYAKTVPAPHGPMWMNETTLYTGLTLVPCTEDESRASRQAIMDWQNS